jgi:hypothetical protein
MEKRDGVQMSSLTEARNAIGQMLAINNQAQAAEIHRLRVANALLREELASMTARAESAEQRHEALTARVIAGEE